MVVGWRPDRGAVPSLGRAGVPLCFGAWVARPPSFAERAGCCMVALTHHVFTASAPLTTLLPPGARWGWHTGWTTPTRTHARGRACSASSGRSGESEAGSLEPFCVPGSCAPRKRGEAGFVLSVYEV